MRKYLLLTGAALIGFSGAAYAAINCAVPPTCDELGYTMTTSDCSGMATLKCPFDQTKVFCVVTPATAVTCTVGAILYNDLKCYDKTPEGKTALGVVFDTSKKLAIALEQHNSISWGEYGTDISGLDNCTSNYTSCETDGKSNTQKIVAALGESSDYAAGLCYTLTHGGLPKGSWFLPSASELKTLWDNKAAVNTGLASLGSPSLPTSGYYWSSTEYSSTNALLLSLIYGVDYFSKYHSSSSYSARCSVAY